MATKLEKDFALIKDEVTKKLDEAAKLIREANALCLSKTGYNICSLECDGVLFDEETGDTVVLNELLGAIDNAGWQTSSMSC